MDEETNKIIADQMKKIPEDIVTSIISVDYKTKLQDITKRQRLLIDQAGKLEMETTLVMIGLEPLADYVENLQRELSVPIMRAKEIAMDVSENIFKPIRASLKAMNEQAEAEESGLKEPVPAVNWVNKRNQSTVSPRLTTDNEPSLNRDQILNEIENPAPLHTELEIRPTQELETLPGQGVKTLPRQENSVRLTGPNLVETKMTDVTITDRQIVDAKPETKLPELKKKPFGGVDPYREEIK